MFIRETAFIRIGTVGGEQGIVFVFYNTFLNHTRRIDDDDGDMGFLGSRVPKAHRGYRQLNLTTLGRLPNRLTSTKCAFYFDSN